MRLTKPINPEQFAEELQAKFGDDVVLTSRLPGARGNDGEELDPIVIVTHKNGAAYDNEVVQQLIDAHVYTPVVPLRDQLLAQVDAAKTILDTKAVLRRVIEVLIQ